MDFDDRVSNEIRFSDAANIELEMEKLEQNHLVIRIIYVQTCFGFMVILNSMA